MSSTISGNDMDVDDKWKRMKHDPVLYLTICMMMLAVGMVIRFEMKGQPLHCKVIVLTVGAVCIMLVLSCRI
jgi:hypothetical protein